MTWHFGTEETLPILVLTYVSQAISCTYILFMYILAYSEAIIPKTTVFWGAIT